MSSLIALGFIVLFGLLKSSNGVINYKFNFESLILSVLSLKSFAQIILNLLMRHVPADFQKFIPTITYILSFFILFVLFKILLEKLGRIPDEEYSKSDRMLGFFVGMLKGYLLITFFVLIFAVARFDSFTPVGVSNSIRSSFINRIHISSILFYRNITSNVVSYFNNLSVYDAYSKSKPLPDVNEYDDWSKSKNKEKK